MFIQPSNLCLLIGIFRPFTFNMIINIVRYKYIVLLLAFYLFHLFIVPLFSFLEYFCVIYFIMVPILSLFINYNYFVILVVALDFMVSFFLLLSLSTFK